MKNTDAVSAAQERIAFWIVQIDLVELDRIAFILRNEIHCLVDDRQRAQP